jgi:DNA-binding NtrC family response regulator
MSLRILIADDERAARFGMVKALASAEYAVAEAADGRAALDAIRAGAADLVFLDLNMPELSGQQVLRELADKATGCEIVVVTANDAISAAVECMRLGASDYITKPLEVEHLRAIARRAAQRVALEQRAHDLQDHLDERGAMGSLVGASSPMRELHRQIERAAKTTVDVLIHGETGTGKELIARQVHRLSDRASGPFVAVNTAAIAESLAESELFGHARGSFTSALSDRQGVFEQADGGTLFLDEIGDMPLAAQRKILRAIQERVVQPVGSPRTITVDVRLVSATHQDLAQAIRDGNFREDLFYRIRGVTLQVPPLRARREDVLLLANYFMHRAAASSGRQTPQLSTEATDCLLAHHWPGNVRELQQMVQAAVAMTPGDVIRPVDLGLPPGRGAAAADFGELDQLPLTEAKARLIETFERRAISAALARHDGNVSAAARQLGIHRQNLQQKMDQWGIRRDGHTA